MENVVASQREPVFSRVAAATSSWSSLPAKSSRLSLRRALRGAAQYAARTADRLHGWSVQRHLKQCGLGHAVSIATWTSKAELYALYDLGLQCPPRALALEIGSYLGASTCYLAAGLSHGGGRLICVDTWQNQTMPEGERSTFEEFSANTRGVADMITPIRKRSDELCAADVHSPIALAFIDGDHSYHAVKEDFERIVPMLAPDGIIAFHDAISYGGVSRVIGEALASGHWLAAGHVQNLFWIKPVICTK